MRARGDRVWHSWNARSPEEEGRPKKRVSIRREEPMVLLLLYPFHPPLPTRTSPLPRRSHELLPSPDQDLASPPPSFALDRPGVACCKRAPRIRAGSSFPDRELAVVQRLARVEHGSGGTAERGGVEGGGGVRCWQGTTNRGP
jgi:hypothetical protein